MGSAMTSRLKNLFKPFSLHQVLRGTFGLCLLSAEFPLNVRTYVCMYVCMHTVRHVLKHFCGMPALPFISRIYGNNFHRLPWPLP